MDRYYVHINVDIYHWWNASLLWQSRLTTMTKVGNKRITGIWLFPEFIERLVAGPSFVHKHIPRGSPALWDLLDLLHLLLCKAPFPFKGLEVLYHSLRVEALHHKACPLLVNPPQSHLPN